MRGGTREFPENGVILRSRNGVILRLREQYSTRGARESADGAERNFGKERDCAPLRVKDRRTAPEIPWKIGAQATIRWAMTQEMYVCMMKI